ncbi:MAG: Aminopeptidase YpdF (MP-, MA-, MS-, AP-, NP- specific) [Ignavibacteriae bacterium]|nr:MAG: Aminopeptidase YpdF (MP-, MA-, MS-, AP-, NP- specific) [Ignavibacteriota bacterium]
MIKEKIKQAVEILKGKDIDMWLTFVRESSLIPDPMIDITVGTHSTWQTAYIITKYGDTIAIAGSLDVANIKAYGYYKDVIGYVESIKEPLLRILDKIKPNKIAINFSTDTVIADGLTHGMYLSLMRYLEGTGYEDKIISSERIISALRGRKSKTEIKYIKEAIVETLRIFDKVSKFIKPGKTEQEVANYILNLVRKTKLETAWDEKQCPAVFSGPESAGAHAEPTKRKIQGGHILNIDFGVRKNGYCSDLQRTWYIRRKGEKTVPKEVHKGFNVIIEAIARAAEALKAGVQGYEIDAIARDYITSQGYKEYPHALGHQIGRSAHDGGGLLCPKWDRYGNLPYEKVETGQVYTLEPRLTVEGYGIATVEEIVLVTDSGCKFLSKPQKQIWVI